ncbi:MAG: fatty acid desaturase [Myxococcota bacterium]|nr:fatty acid desaturase [Myxococcota bacterium]
MDVQPHTIDQLSREKDVRLRDLWKVIPKDCFEIKPAKSWFTFFRICFCISAFSYAIYLVPVGRGPELLWQIPVLCCLWLLQGFTVTGLFVLGHECGHRAFSKRKWVNQVIGHICFSPLSNALHTWTVTHDHHHAHTQRRGEEVDWAAHLKTKDEFEQTNWKKDTIVRIGYALPFGIFFWIISNTLRRGFLVRRQIGEQKFQKEKTTLLLSNLIMMTTLGTIYAGLYAYDGVWGILKYYAIPGFITTLCGALIITVQHANRHTLSYTKEGWTPLRGQLVSTFDVRFPRLLEWLWLDITIHIPHHIAPSMPWYNLRRASQAISEAFPEYYQTQKFSRWHLEWFAQTPFLHEIKDKGVFVMDLPDNREFLEA